MSAFIKENKVTVELYSLLSELLEMR